MTETYVYALYEESTENRRAYFYVGQTNNIPRRMREHRSRRDVGGEDLYEYLRALQHFEVKWTFERLQTVCGDDKRHAEQEHVIRLVRDGHELKSMRKGSIIRLVELAKTDPALAGRLATMNLGSAGNKLRDGSGGAASRRLRRKVLRSALDRMLKRDGIPDLAACTEMKALVPITYRRIVGREAKKGDTIWVAPGDMRLRDLITYARNANLWPHVDKIGNDLRSRGYPV